MTVASRNRLASEGWEVRLEVKYTVRRTVESRSEAPFRRVLRKPLVTPMDLSTVISSLSIREIRDAALPLAVPAPCQKKKNVLMSFVLENMTPGVEKNLWDKLATRTSVRTGTSLRKRKRDEPQPTPARKSPRIDTDEPNDDDGEFLELPSDVTLKSCYCQFYKATSSAALEHVVCAVCARERGRQPDSCGHLFSE